MAAYSLLLALIFCALGLLALFAMVVSAFNQRDHGRPSQPSWRWWLGLAIGLGVVAAFV